MRPCGENRSEVTDAHVWRDRTKLGDRALAADQQETLSVERHAVEVVGEVPSDVSNRSKSWYMFIRLSDYRNICSTLGRLIRLTGG